MDEGNFLVHGWGSAFTTILCKSEIIVRGSEEERRGVEYDARDIFDSTAPTMGF